MATSSGQVTGNAGARRLVNTEATPGPHVSPNENGQVTWNALAGHTLVLEFQTNDVSGGNPLPSITSRRVYLLSSSTLTLDIRGQLPITYRVTALPNTLANPGEDVKGGDNGRPQIVVDPEIIAEFARNCLPAFIAASKKAGKEECQKRFEALEESLRDGGEVDLIKEGRALLDCINEVCEGDREGKLGRCCERIQQFLMNRGEE
jgi:hypothetical protein